VPGSKQRSSRKHLKTRQSSLTNLLQHIIKGQASALTTIQDFSDFTVRIRIYESGITYDWQTVFLYPNPWGNSGTVTLDAGDYDIHIQVQYSAKDLAEATSGQAVITVSY